MSKFYSPIIIFHSPKTRYVPLQRSAISSKAELSHYRAPLFHQGGSCFHHSLGLIFICNVPRFHHSVSLSYHGSSMFHQNGLLFYDNCNLPITMLQCSITMPHCPQTVLHCPFIKPLSHLKALFFHHNASLSYHNCQSPITIFHCPTTMPSVKSQCFTVPMKWTPVSSE